MIDINYLKGELLRLESGESIKYTLTGINNVLEPHQIVYFYKWCDMNSIDVCMNSGPTVVYPYVEFKRLDKKIKVIELRIKK